MVLRSDEAAHLAEEERDKKFRSNLGKGIKTAVGVGTAIGVSPHLSKVLPLLNEYVPTDLALKGLEKVSPKLGKFLRKGQEMGLDVKEGMDFIKEKISPEKEVKPSQEQPKDDRNIIQKYSPPLFDYLKNLIAQGNKPSQAALKAKQFLDENQKKIIKQIENDYKSDLVNIVESIFGQEEMGQSKAALQAEIQPQNSPNPVDEQILATLQKIMQM